MPRNLTLSDISLCENDQPISEHDVQTDQPILCDMCNCKMTITHQCDNQILPDNKDQLSDDDNSNTYAISKIRLKSNTYVGLPCTCRTSLWCHIYNANVQSVIMCGLRCTADLIVLIVLSKLDTNPSTLIDTKHHQKSATQLDVYQYTHVYISSGWCQQFGNAYCCCWNVMTKMNNIDQPLFSLFWNPKLLCQTNPQATSSMASSPYYSNLFFFFSFSSNRVLFSFFLVSFLVPVSFIFMYSF